MTPQHDVPPAILRLWWRIPNWTRVLPVLGGSLLAPMALVSTSMPVPVDHAPDIAAPVAPSTAPRPTIGPAPATPVVLGVAAANPAPATVTNGPATQYPAAHTTTETAAQTGATTVVATTDGGDGTTVNSGVANSESPTPTPTQQAQPRENTSAPVLIGGSCSHQGQASAYTSGKAAVCVTTADGALLWRQA